MLSLNSFFFLFCRKKAWPNWQVHYYSFVYYIGIWFGTISFSIFQPPSTLWHGWKVWCFLLLIALKTLDSLSLYILPFFFLFFLLYSLIFVVVVVIVLIMDFFYIINLITRRSKYINWILQLKWITYSNSLNSTYFQIQLIHIPTYFNFKLTKTPYTQTDRHIFSGVDVFFFHANMLLSQRVWYSRCLIHYKTL